MSTQHNVSPKGPFKRFFAENPISLESILISKIAWKNHSYNDCGPHSAKHVPRRPNYVRFSWKWSLIHLKIHIEKSEALALNSICSGAFRRILDSMIPRIQVIINDGLSGQIVFFFLGLHKKTFSTCSTIDAIFNLDLKIWIVQKNDFRRKIIIILSSWYSKAHFYGFHKSDAVIHVNTSQSNSMSQKSMTNSKIVPFKSNAALHEGNKFKLWKLWFRNFVWALAAKFIISWTNSKSK